MKSLLTALAVLALAFVTAAQSKQQDPAELNKSLSDVRSKQQELQKKINRVNSQRNRVKRDIKAVDQDLTRVSSQLIQTSNRLEGSIERRNALASDVEQASSQMAESRGRVEDRLRQMYRQSDHSVLTLLVGADSVGDFAERKVLLERIAKRDKELFESYKQLKTEIGDKKSEQERLIGEISSLKSQHEQRQGELEEVQQEKKEVLKDLTAEQRKLQKEFDEFDRQERILAAKIRQYQSGKAGTAGALSFGGSMIKPAEGPYTSGFGNRFHPILKRNRPHNGVDIGAANRSRISAAADGVVITAGWINGFGNTVVIDHGDGVSTLYGHCSVIYAKEGQTVQQGDKIAAVGSTGLATGPHLHFEVRVNGSPRNPRNYLP